MKRMAWRRQLANAGSAGAPAEIFPFWIQADSARARLTGRVRREDNPRLRLAN